MALAALLKMLPRLCTICGRRASTAHTRVHRFDQLQAVNTDGVVPAIHASKQGTALRVDTPAAYADRCVAVEPYPVCQPVQLECV